MFSYHTLAVVAPPTWEWILIYLFIFKLFKILLLYLDMVHIEQGFNVCYKSTWCPSIAVL